MGKRETNTERLRTSVLTTALEAFERDGYEATTMEHIAEAAGIGVATLYRHFSTKDAILVTPAASSIRRIPLLLVERPIDEPLGESLGAVLDQAIRQTAPQADLVRRIYDILKRATGPTGHLLERWSQEEFRVAAEIRRRTGAGPDELWVELTASTLMMIYAQTMVRLSSDLNETNGPAMLRRLTALLAAPTVVFPRFAELGESDRPAAR